jgi:polar amino acid transport system permease protein
MIYFLGEVIKRKQKISSVTAWIKFLLTIILLFWLMDKSAERLGYNWQWYRVPDFIFSYKNGQFQPGPLLQGLMITFQITVISFFLCMILGLVTALMRLSDSFAARMLARFYLEMIRNTPLLIQIFFIYFVISPVLEFSAFTSAVLSLSLFEGAYASEIIRAGIVSIDKSQWDAAYSLGISRLHTYRYIVLPQALRRVLPPLTGQTVSLIKDSALVSTISIYDLTMQGRAIISKTFLTFEIWFTVAMIYLVITATVSLLARLLENLMAYEKG